MSLVFLSFVIDLNILHNILLKLEINIFIYHVAEKTSIYESAQCKVRKVSRGTPVTYEMTSSINRQLSGQ